MLSRLTSLRKVSRPARNSRGRVLLHSSPKPNELKCPQLYEILWLMHLLPNAGPRSRPTIHPKLANKAKDGQSVPAVLPPVFRNNHKASQNDLSVKTYRVACDYILRCEGDLYLLTDALENYSASNGCLPEPEFVRCRLTWGLNRAWLGSQKNGLTEHSGCRRPWKLPGFLCTTLEEKTPSVVIGEASDGLEGIKRPRNSSPIWFCLTLGCQS